MPLYSRRLRTILLACWLPLSVVAENPKAPMAGATDPLGAAMDAAKVELVTRNSWAKDIPPVAEARRKGGTLLIGIGTPTPANSTQWKSWWEQTICEAPELKRILLLDGGVLVFSGAEPKPNEGVQFNKGDCYRRVPGWNTKEAENTHAPMTPSAAKRSNTAEPNKPTPPSKPEQEDPFGLVASFVRLNDVVVERQLQTAEKPETAARIAVFKKNLYSALLSQGFSKGQAISIVNNTPIPSLWR